MRSLFPVRRRFVWLLLMIPLRIIGAILVPVVRYLLLWLIWPVLVYCFRQRNRLVTVRPRGLRLHGGVLITSIHASHLDSFVTGLALCYPDILWKPWLQPWQLADGHNSMFIRPLYRIMRIIPVGRDAQGERRDHQAFKRAVQILRNGGVVNSFIEGTRSPTGDLLPPKPQIAAMALKAGAEVWPVYHCGMLDAVPYRKKPGDGDATAIRKRFGPLVEWIADIRRGKTIYVAVGEVLTPSVARWIAGNSDNDRECYRQLALSIMHRIAAWERTVRPLVRFYNAS